MKRAGARATRLPGRWALAALTGAASLAHAATYDPDLTWRTIKTEHFFIHFHQGEEALAEEFTRVAEEVYDTMVEEIRWEPQRRTELVLIDRTDYANGFASVVPYNMIVIYVTAPTPDSTLGLYEDWNTTILTHELTHVLHMDTNHGIVRVARAVVGRIASTNNLSPGWMVEGLATFQETRHTSGGRGRATIPDMIKRTAVVEDDFPPLGNLDGFQPEPPSGNLRYLFGQDFIQYIADHRGEDVWTRWVHLYGGHVPYILPGKQAFGRPLQALYRDWRAHLGERYGAQADAVRAEGETTSVRLVSGGEDSCVAPAFSPDGERLVWSCYDLHLGSAIWMSDGSGYAREKLLQDRGAGYFTWRADSKAFVYAGSHLVNRFNVWSDIYMYTLGGDAVALTSGARARDPDFSPDGSRLLYVTNKVQNNQLEVMTVDRRREALTTHDDHTQIATPRFSPDGTAVAMSLWVEGRTDIWITDPEGVRLRRVTSDDAIDADPQWSADGRYLYFSSDRTGIPNIYAVELASERLFQVTNVVTGATRPTVHPSGERIAFQRYSKDGWDIVVLDDPQASFVDRGLLPAPARYDAPLSRFVSRPRGEAATAVAAAWETAPERAPRGPRLGLDALSDSWSQAPEETLQSFDDADADDVFGEEQDFPFTIPPRRYNPLPTLVPRYLSPFVFSTPFGNSARLREAVPWAPWAVQAQVLTSSADTLRHWAWGAALNYRTDVETFGGGASLTWNRWIPVFSAGLFTAANTPAALTLVDPDIVDENGELVLLRCADADALLPECRYWERRTTGYFQVSWPYRLRSTAFARYSLSERHELFPLPREVYLPLIPMRGTVGSISGGWRYSWEQATAYAISREDGRIFSLVGALLHPWLGSFIRDERNNLQPLTQFQVTSEIREYVVNPLLENHVLAARAGGGITFGSNDFLGNYQLGGSFGDSAFYVTPEEFRMLRGYPFGADVGDMYWLGTLEYRFPIWQIQRGLGTLPFFARNLSGAVFLDTGNAFNSPAQLGGGATAADLLEAAAADPLAGTGAELSFRSVLGWGFAVTGRLGYAVGLTEGGIRPEDGLSAMYFQLGGSF